MQQKNKLLILGAGAWGSALALVANARNDEVYVWDRNVDHIAAIHQTRQNHYLPGIIFPKTIHFCSDLAKALALSSDVLVVVPSSGVREALEKIKANYHHPLAISIASKGLDPMTADFFHNTVKTLFDDTFPMGVLSGPSFAMEVAKRLPTALTFASQNALLCERMVARLNCPYFRLYHSTDVIGVQLGGVMKNVVAIGAGISAGLNLGANARSALITRGLAEMMRLGRALGAQFETLAGLAGVGDLILTCTDQQSRNYRFGIKIGQGKSRDQALIELNCLVEGVENVAVLLKQAQHHQIVLPISEQIHQILYQNKAALTALSDLLARATKAENF